ncbi:hypothetical protein H8356DRAFT_1622914 [Neocallimastix lanati (nom. inval.)]|nr:hypothetical protein H8356DRAFT_1622914 [Neocallimastix sp. JGI-2020a]
MKVIDRLMFLFIHIIIILMIIKSINRKIRILIIKRIFNSIFIFKSYIIRIVSIFIHI